MINRGLCVALIGLLLSVFVTPTFAAPKCSKTSRGFSSWLKEFKKEAMAKGITKKTINRTLYNVSYNSTVIRYDRNQKSFKKGFKAFYRLRVNNALINRGKRLKKRHASLFNRIEKKYGVPAEILLSIWGLETQYGSYKGNPMPIFESLATLSFDCRRSAFFKKELMAALKIIQRGWMRPGSMHGAWAGEIGQTQFLPSSYVKYAVDFDGNGRRDLINSTSDVLASTANYLKGKGWKRGASWKPGTHNYRVLREWNKAGVYVKTISVMAQKMKG